MRMSDLPAQNTATVVMRLWWWLRLLLAVVMVLGGILALVLHLLILPNLHHLRPMLEQLASHQLGVPVRIAQLRVSQSGWQPEIEMDTVALYGAQGRQSLHIRRVQAVVSLQAAVRGGFERLTVDAPHIRAHRFANGQIEVAGIAVTQGKKSDSGSLLNWLLSQPELVVRNASLHWSDDQRGVPPLDLTAVSISLYNQSNHHSLQLQATPPAGWGEPLELVAQWSHPLLRDRTQWRNWRGMVYTNMPALDVSQLRQYVDMGQHMDLRQGQGSLRLWADFDALHTNNLVAEAHLRAVHVRLGADLPPLELADVDTLLNVQYRDGAEDGRAYWALNTAQLQFATPDGYQWPAGSHLQLELTGGADHPDSQGRIRGSAWDVGTIVALARKLPLGTAVLDMLDTYQPGGQLQELDVNWHGSLDKPMRFSARGQASQIHWRAQQGPFDARTGHFEPGVPGVEGADVQFDVQHDQGQMHIRMRHGAVTLPGVFEQPRLDFTELHAPVQWRIQGQHVLVQVQQARLANADLRGSLDASWHTLGAPFVQTGGAVPHMVAAATLPRLSGSAAHAAQEGASAATSRLQQLEQALAHPPDMDASAAQAARGAWLAAQRRQHPAGGGMGGDTARHEASAVQSDAAADIYPGVLHLQASIESARADRVHRYLPLSIGDAARYYVRDAVLAGDIQQARVHIAGNLDHLPARTQQQAQQSQFRFEVPLRHARYRFVPPNLQPRGELPWPELTDLNGLLVIDQHQLSIHRAQGRFSTAPDLRIHSLSAHIPHLGQNLTVGVSAQAEGPLEQALHLTNTSPLGALAHHALQKATATGNAKLSLALGLPVMAMQHATVQGQLQLLGNDVRITPDTPLLADSRGHVHFDHKGFALQSVRTRLLGGEAVLTGGSSPVGRQRRVAFAAKGEFTAEGLLQEETSLGAIARLGKHMQGRSRYQAALQFHRGVPELTIDSTLQGMALNLPAPLHKPASHSLPLHLENTLTDATATARTQGASALTDSLLVRLGDVLQVQYIRDVSQGTPRVLRGSMAVGSEALQHMPPVPDDDVQAYVRLDAVDADGWQRVLDSLSARTTPAMPVPVSANAHPHAHTTADHTRQYLPTVVAVLTPTLHIAHRRFDNLILAGTRSNWLWNFTLDARQLSGSVQYLQPQEQSRSAGMLKARLQRLLIEPATVQDVKNIVAHTQDPQSLPALDVQVEHLDVLGYRFSDVSLLAGNSARAQNSSGVQLDDTAEDAISNAWRIHALTAHVPHGRLEANGLWALPRYGGADRRPVAVVVRLQTSDLGALLRHFALPDVVSGGSGVFSGTLRWRGSPIQPELAALTGSVRADIRQGRITQLDSPVFKLLGLLSLRSLAAQSSAPGSKGMAYERIAGTVDIRKGIATSNNLQLASALAQVYIGGQASLPEQTLNLDVLVQPQIDLGGAALLATAVNPLLGAGSYVVQWLLSQAVNHAAIQVFDVSGSWNQPVIERVQDTEAVRRKAQQIRASQTQTSLDDYWWNWQPVTQPTQRHRLGASSTASAPAAPASVATAVAEPVSAAASVPQHASSDVRP